MKNLSKMSKILMMAVATFFFCATASGQMNTDEIFNGVKNTKKVSTLDLLHMDRSVSTFSDMVAMANLEVSLALADSQHTLFVPTNEAFAEMSIEEFAKLTDPKNRVKLIAFVKRHYLPNKVLEGDFEDSQIVTTDSEEEITVSESGNTVTIGGAEIVKGDIQSSDGVIHIVDQIIEPTSDVVGG